MNHLLLFAAASIIFCLTSYAAYLLFKLKKQNMAQKQEQQRQSKLQQQKRNAIYADIRYIAQAMIDDRCELSEGVMRIAKLFEQAAMAEHVQTEYPGIFAHFAVIEHHPIMNARKQLDKQARMKLDLKRMKSESKLEQSILEDAKKLIDFNNKIH
ncbi:DUF2489 domain-containing protein [Shewanella gelidii]|uniref:DUF2489 domain-containing protein n=1 Tax=Shewanella gelidii TaxID=1642821 RepID=UPI00166B885E|nr:DUF2489 domain-containing protein [Shewanella gelidii]